MVLLLQPEAGPHHEGAATGVIAVSQRQMARPHAEWVAWLLQSTIGCGSQQSAFVLQARYDMVYNTEGGMAVKREEAVKKQDKHDSKRVKSER